jgi:SAM-dependent methyltransferase
MSSSTSTSVPLESKRTKLDRLRPLLKTAPIKETAHCLDFLSPELREKFSIVDTTNVSAHGYDPYAQAIINENKDGLVLDCGAGSRGDYLANVVNYEIVDYPSTDVRGVAEALPFRDAVFDGALCLNVLEHVKDPFCAAREIARVMKPGARLYCVVPFLQPVHAYPHHYYNMTAEGLRNLFAEYLVTDRQEVIAGGLPVWTLSWFLGSWVNGLPVEKREPFLNMRVADLIGDPMRLLDADFVRFLSIEKNFELASTTALFAHKS